MNDERYDLYAWFRRYAEQWEDNRRSAARTRQDYFDLRSTEVVIQALAPDTGVSAMAWQIALGWVRHLPVIRDEDRRPSGAVKS